MRENIVIILLALVLTSCAPEIKEEKSYKRIPNPPDLVKDRAAITGTIRWKGTGVAGLTVLLCDHVSAFDSLAGFKCDKKYGETRTDENGAYWFKDLESSGYKEGEYRSYIPVAVVDGSPPGYFFWQKELLGSDSIFPEKNETYEVKPLDIYRVDLRLTGPIGGQKITDRRPALMWDEYPDANNYSVYLAGDFIGNRDKTFRLDSEKPGAKPVEDLPNGKYFWEVTARGKDNVEIAQSPKSNFFNGEPTPNGGSFEIVDELPRGRR
jgi:hypothetical protein